MGIKIKIRLSRKVVIILSSAIVLFGASGAAALYLGREAILGPSHESIYGLECHDVVRIADVRGRDIPWLRKYIRVENSEGEARLKTALRVAEHMRHTLPAELIHVAVLDENGPEVRAQMRGRAFGAEVFIFPEPEKVPGVVEEYSGYYYDGHAADGVFYGEKHDVSERQLEKMASLMEETEDCTPPEDKDAAAGETSGHGASSSSSSGHGEAQPEGGESAGHGETSDGGGDGHEEASEPGMFGKMLSLIGLGSDEETGEHGDQAGHGEAVDGHGETAPAHGSADDAGGHTAAESGHDEASVDHSGNEPSFFDKMKNMVGLGSGADHNGEEAHGASEPGAGHGEESHSEEDAAHEAGVTDAQHGDGHEASDGEAGGHGSSEHDAAEEHENSGHEEDAGNTPSHDARSDEEHAMKGHSADAKGEEAGHETLTDTAPEDDLEHAGGDKHEAGHQEAKLDHGADAEASSAHGDKPVDSLGLDGEQPGHQAEVEPDESLNGWDGGEDGEIVIIDGPSDDLMLGWQDEALDAATQAAHPNGAGLHLLEKESGSRAEGGAEAAHH